MIILKDKSVSIRNKYKHLTLCIEILSANNIRPLQNSMFLQMCKKTQKTCATIRNSVLQIYNIINDPV